MSTFFSLTPSDNLHYRPLSAHLARGTVFVSTYMQKGASRNQWHGHVVVFLSKALIVTSCIISIPLSLIEIIASSSIALVGITLNKFIFSNKNDFLQKHTVKLLAFSLHSLVSTAYLIALSVKRPHLKLYTLIAFGDHAIHLGSAALLQMTYGVYLDRAANRDPNFATQRLLHLFSDSHPYLLNDVLNQIQRDVGGIARDYVTPRMDEYLRNHPEARNFLENLDPWRIFRDAEYRNQGIQIAHQYVIDALLIAFVENVEREGIIELYQHTLIENQYQNHLAQTLKAALLEIHGNEELWSHLSLENDRGIDLLEMMDATTYLPIATYTAYKELLQDRIHCPENFTGNLEIYNGRRAKIQAAKNLVQQLSNQEQKELVKKILNGGDRSESRNVQDAFLKIGELAAPLYQGPLMTRSYFNFNGEDFGDFIQTQNLFQKMYEEFLNEISG